MCSFSTFALKSWNIHVPDCVAPRVPRMWKQTNVLSWQTWQFYRNCLNVLKAAFIVWVETTLVEEDKYLVVLLSWACGHKQYHFWRQSYFAAYTKELSHKNALTMLIYRGGGDNKRSCSKQPTGITDAGMCQELLKFTSSCGVWLNNISPLCHCSCQPLFWYCHLKHIQSINVFVMVFSCGLDCIVNDSLFNGHNKWSLVGDRLTSLWLLMWQWSDERLWRQLNTPLRALSFSIACCFHILTCSQQYFVSVDTLVFPYALWRNLTFGKPLLNPTTHSSLSSWLVHVLSEWWWWPFQPVAAEILFFCFFEVKWLVL